MVFIDALMHVGRYPDALAAIDQLSSLSPDHELIAWDDSGPVSAGAADMKNFRAYYAAVGKIELDRALADITAVLNREHWPEKPREQPKDFLTTAPPSRIAIWPGLIDTRAMVHLARGEVDAAQEDYQYVLLMTGRPTWDVAQDVYRNSHAGEMDPRGAAMTYQKMLHEWAVLKSHQADIAAAAGRDAQAHEIRELLRRLGYPIGKHLF